MGLIEWGFHLAAIKGVVGLASQGRQRVSQGSSIPAGPEQTLPSRLEVLEESHKPGVILLLQPGNMVISNQELQGLWIIRAIGHPSSEDLGMAQGLSSFDHAMPREDGPILGNHHVP